MNGCLNRIKMVEMISSIWEYGYSNWKGYLLILWKLRRSQNQYHATEPRCMQVCVFIWCSIPILHTNIVICTVMHGNDFVMQQIVLQSGLIIPVNLAFCTRKTYVTLDQEIHSEQLDLFQKPLVWLAVIPSSDVSISFHRKAISIQSPLSFTELLKQNLCGLFMALCISFNRFSIQFHHLPQWYPLTIDS